MSDLNGEPVGLEDLAKWLLRRMYRTLSRLRLWSRLALATTGMSVIGAVVSFFVGQAAASVEPDDFYSVSPTEYRVWFMALYVPVVVCAVVALAQFESARRTGDALSDELADIVQRSVASENGEVELDFDRDVSVEHRVLVREYRLQRTLPFLSNERDLGTYVLINLLLVGVSLIGLFLAS